MKTMKSIGLVLACLALSVLSFFSVAAEEGAENASKGLSTGALVSLIIAGVVLVAVVVLCVIRREKLKESLRAYRREMKNITWYPWKSVWRNTVLVVVVVLVAALLIGLLDIAFFEGQYLLTGKGVHFFGGN
ncbi:MAG: preprotein translocase subunit SecE [Clostridia bacterium]|nr:preprotein translocase subunit SecE [Clostridia bacterium]MDD7700333.1 preprotein translocase subunit SecE [Eubacteriales bacterium]MDY2826962.1 preprotein translocase subunit SecE [Eubacteriales bacterium]